MPTLVTLLLLSQVACLLLSLPLDDQSLVIDFEVFVIEVFV